MLAQEVSSAVAKRSHCARLSARFNRVSSFHDAEQLLCERARFARRQSSMLAKVGAPRTAILAILGNIDFAARRKDANAKPGERIIQRNSRSFPREHA